MNRKDILIEQALELCARVVEKCERTAEDGRQMKSIETYHQCKAWLKLYDDSQNRGLIPKGSLTGKITVKKEE